MHITEILPGMAHTPEFSLNRLRGDAGRAESIYQDVDRPLTAEDVALVVVAIAEMPEPVNIDEIAVRPVAQRSQRALYRVGLGWRDSAPIKDLSMKKGAY